LPSGYAYLFGAAPGIAAETFAELRGTVAKLTATVRGEG
jgi:hypothetical protein